MTTMLYSPHMAANNRTKKRKATLDSVLSTVERGFADLEGQMERGFAAVADDITDIKSKMATKDDIANLGGQLTSVERELKSIRRDLDDLREKGRECLRLPESKIRALFPRFSCCVTSTRSAHSCPRRPICYTSHVWQQRK